MKEVALSQGKFSIVDDEDFERVSLFNWFFDGRYASTWTKKKKMFMHRFILDDPKGMDIDHLNLDKLDNRRENLRICTRSQNFANKPLFSTNTSGYKGVSYHKKCKKWQAYINNNYKKYHLGLFSDPESAHEAYKKAAREIFGEFARFE